MRPVLCIVSVFALLAIVFEFILPVPASGVFGTFTVGTAADLAFCAGILALVDMAQRRRWSWFARLLVTTLITVYGPVIFVTVLPYTGIPLGMNGFTYTLVSVVTLAVTPLAALVYALPQTNNIKYV